MVVDNPHLPKTSVAKHYGIARSALYVIPRQPQKDKILLTQVLTVIQDHPHYGYRRVALLLGKNKKPTQRVMKKYGLKPKRRKAKFRKKADEKNLPSGIANRLKTLCPITANAVWAGDFTYLSFYGKNVYLATVIDVYTREIVGVFIGLHHTSQLVIAALEDAKQKRVKLPQIFHTDQGSEYASQSCRLWLLAEKILPSHSHKAHPWENGYQESFYGKFKKELGNIHRFTTLEDLMAGIYRQVYYYNNERIHSRLKMSPRQFYLQSRRN